MKPYLSWQKQVKLMSDRGLIIKDEVECIRFLTTVNYYRFSGYVRYFQIAPHKDNNDFCPGTSFNKIREIYYADEELRTNLLKPLSCVELMLRSHVAHIIGREYGPYHSYLEEDFYVNPNNRQMIRDSCLRDIERSKERHILHYRNDAGGNYNFDELPVWSAVEAWSFGTLSKVIEYGGQGSLADSVAASICIAKGGFASRIKALVYLRNRCAHYGRLWHHSVVDAGPTPNNVRKKAKRIAGQFGNRSIVDVIASLDDICVRGKVMDTSGKPLDPELPKMVKQYKSNSDFWCGLVDPKSPKDHKAHQS